MKTKKIKLIIILIYFLLAILFVRCADVVSIEKCVVDEPYGFWGGFWHGWIAPIAWIGSLFSDDIAIYAVNNNGGWYDSGFILGIGGLSFSSSQASK